MGSVRDFTREAGRTQDRSGPAKRKVTRATLRGRTSSPGASRVPGYCTGVSDAGQAPPKHARPSTGAELVLLVRVPRHGGSRPRPVEGTHPGRSAETRTVYSVHRRETRSVVSCRHARVTPGRGVALRKERPGLSPGSAGSGPCLAVPVRGADALGEKPSLGGVREFKSSPFNT